MEPMILLERSAEAMFGPVSALTLGATFWLAVSLPLVWAAANLLKRCGLRP